MIRKYSIALTPIFILTLIVMTNANSVQLPNDIENQAMKSLGYEISMHTNSYLSNKYALPQPFSTVEFDTYKYVGTTGSKIITHKLVSVK